MNPRTGTYSRSWKRKKYDGEWILERFAAVRALALEASGSEPQSPVEAVRTTEPQGTGADD
jgi:hypothetical protein